MFSKRFWTSKNIIFTVLVIALLLIFPKIVGILMLFFGSYVIACALNPFVTKLMNKMSRPLASSIVMFSSILAIIALFIPIFFVAFREIKTFMITLPDKVTEFANFLMNFKINGSKLPDIVDIDAILNNSSDVAQNVVNHSLSITAGIIQAIVILVAMTMIVYYILI